MQANIVIAWHCLCSLPGPALREGPNAQSASQHFHASMSRVVPRLYWVYRTWQLGQLSVY